MLSHGTIDDVSIMCLTDMTTAAAALLCYLAIRCDMYIRYGVKVLVYILTLYHSHLIWLQHHST
jgi:hypothetical protein